MFRSSSFRQLALTGLLTGAAMLPPASASAQSNAPLTAEQGRRLVSPFYDMLNKPATKDLKALADAAIAPEWRSYSGEGVFKTRDEFIGQVTGFGKLIPDLAWDLKEVFVDGNHVIVRSEATGTPVGPLFGVAPGGKSFRIMTIDIHTVQGDKLIAAHHVEDWAGAIRQLSAK
jgi:predicted ester cyclase